MDCHSVVSRLSAYQDHELAVSDREAIESHLSGCPSCKEQFLKLQQAWEALGSLPDLNVSPGLFYRQIQRRLNDTRNAPVQVPTFGGWFQRLLPTSAVASLVALGIVLGAVAGNSLVGRSSAQPSAHEDSLLSSLSVFDPVPPGSVADGLNRLMAANERGNR
jgi:anti-sigma factor RsiW